VGNEVTSRLPGGDLAGNTITTAVNVSKREKQTLTATATGYDRGSQPGDGTPFAVHGEKITGKGLTMLLHCDIVTMQGRYTPGSTRTPYRPTPGP
jgi:hypothetical protein